MRVLVCGGREFDDWDLMSRYLTSLYLECEDRTSDNKVDFTIIEGGARGADFLARVWAKFRYLPFEEFPADWKQFGKSAGFLRNQQMLIEGKPDVVLAFEGGNGTASMVRLAKDAGVKVIEVPERYIIDMSSTWANRLQAELIGKDS